MKYFLPIIILLLLSGAGVRAENGGFRDDFDSIDPTRWYLSHGWVNGDHQNCTWSNWRIGAEDSILKLELAKQPFKEREYICSEIQSKDRYGYGLYEMRMKIPYTSGLNANFFTFIGHPQDEPHNEIDFEFVGNRPDTVMLNYHFEGDSEHGKYVDAPNASSQFNTYSFLWKPGHIQWFINEELVHEAKGDDIPNIPQKMYFSVWGTDTLTDWMGEFEYPGHPLVLEVDWVEYTPLEDVSTSKYPQ